VWLTNIPHLSSSLVSHQCCGSGKFIPDPFFSIPDPGLKRSRIRICVKEVKSFLSSQKYDPGCLSRIPDLDFFSHPGSLGQKSTGSWIRIRNTERSQRFTFIVCTVRTSDDLYYMVNTVLTVSSAFQTRLMLWEQSDTTATAVVRERSRGKRQIMYTIRYTVSALAVEPYLQNSDGFRVPLAFGINLETVYLVT
jgi:hypothetical protein